MLARSSSTRTVPGQPEHDASTLQRSAWHSANVSNCSGTTQQAGEIQATTEGATARHTIATAAKQKRRNIHTWVTVLLPHSRARQPSTHTQQRTQRITRAKTRSQQGKDVHPVKHRVPMPSTKRPWGYKTQATSVQASAKLGVAYAGAHQLPPF